MNCCIYPNTGNDGCRGAAAADSAFITASSLGRFFRGFS